ncbi:MAG: DUF4956 domain-containing protein [Lachnospiraceae bacterium]|nr:DUF4956 domain-containing protein [Lachnospiraceae bacterium]
MVEKLFTSVFNTARVTEVYLKNFLICIIGALIAGFIVAVVYMFKSNYSKSFVVTLLILPAIVASVIIMVNGNIGAGVAVAGAFSLVRFRSAPGSAKEISAIFLAMAAGLVMGMGYIGFGFLLTVIISLVLFVCNLIGFGEMKKDDKSKLLKITIPEDLDYTEVFDDLFATFTQSANLVQVKTVSMGSLFKLSYEIVLKDESKEKEFIDALRCRNGNLEILSTRLEVRNNDL